MSGGGVADWLALDGPRRQPQVRGCVDPPPGHARHRNSRQAQLREVEDGVATCRTKADAPEIDGNLFVDEGFEQLTPGDIATVEVDEAGEYDLWGR